jgi:sugar phosphate isomerase/epimerase
MHAVSTEIPASSPQENRRNALRIGATSYVIPAGLVENVRHLAGQVDDMELVLFDLPGGPSNLPTPAQVRELAAIGQGEGLSYTVHLPVDLPAQPAGEPVHTRLIQAQAIIEQTLLLEPHAYVFHLDGMAVRSPETPLEHLQRWQQDALFSLELLYRWVGKWEQLALENVEGYSLDFLDPFSAHLPIARCVDIGHLWVDGHDPLPYLRRWLSTTQVIHLHGLTGRDHLSLAHTSPAQLDPLVALLVQEKFDGILTLEVFEDDFTSSLAALRDSLERGGDEAKRG